MFQSVLSKAVRHIARIWKEETVSEESPLDHLRRASIKDSYSQFASQIPQSMLFEKKTDMWRYAIDLAARHQEAGSGLFLEFGVAAGTSLRFFADALSGSGQRIVGFDAFLGLEEDWTGHPHGRTAGAYSQSGDKPEIRPNSSLRVGWVQDTLSPFLSEESDSPVIFAHLDMDTYTPTEFVLRNIRGRLIQGSVLLFDELYGYPGWRQHEYAALTSVFSEDEFEYLAFGREQVAIRIL